MRKALIRIITVAFTAAFAVTVAMAQSAESKKAVDEFAGHWFMQLHGGVGYTVGETSFDKLLSPAADIYVGYRFTPVWGLRAGFSGWQGKGAAIYYSEPYSFQYLQAGVDVMADLASAISGYRRTRLFTPYLYAGAGAAFGLDNSEILGVQPTFDVETKKWESPKVFPLGHMGCGVDIRLCDAVKIGVEIGSSVLPDAFNSKLVGNADWQLEAKAGLTFNFGLGKKSRRAAADVAPAQTFVPDSQEQAEDPAPAKKAEPVVQTPAVTETPVKEEAPKAEFKEVKEDIFFTIGKYELNAEEVSKLDDIAGILGRNPDTKVQVTGYADVKTGTAKRNMYLSKKRAEAVAAYLEGKGIASERISIDYKGSTEQPYDTPQKNRVAVCLIK